MIWRSHNVLGGRERRLDAVHGKGDLSAVEEIAAQHTCPVGGIEDGIVVGGIGLDFHPRMIQESASSSTPSTCGVQRSEIWDPAGFQRIVLSCLTSLSQPADGRFPGRRPPWPGKGLASEIIRMIVMGVSPHRVHRTAVWRISSRPVRPGPLDGDRGDSGHGRRAVHQSTGVPWVERRRASILLS
jgi:hypothetical protein